MTNTKTTKRALLTSTMALFLCFAMLLGTTYAWFADSVTSANNIIQSGNLDIELDYWNGTAWKTVEGASDIINGDRWEPGYTKVAYLRLRNAGSLALKYQLGVNILSEKEGINQAGDTFRLSNYIMFGVVEDLNGETNAYTKDDAGRTKAIADVTDAKKIYEGYTKADSLAANSGYVYLAMVVYMPTDVGNVANHNGTDIPKIDLGINVFATQMTAEEDSFDNQYDANAAFSVWNGVVPTEMPDSLVVDGATQTVHVKDAAAFAYLSTLSADWATLYSDGQGTTYTNYANGAGANYYYSGQWKVSLEADIDLNNCALAPVDIVFGQSTGATAFNGNGHTIRNVTAGLFADGTRASFSNLTLENVKATNGALAGIVNHPVSDITVKNATVSGADYVGGLVGKTYSSVTRCKVIDSSVVATGKEAGGLIGYAEANSKGSTITNNVINNVSVYAGNRAAGLVAQPNTTVKVYNNTVDTVNVGAQDCTEYQPGAVVSNPLAPENVYDNTVIGDNKISGKVGIATNTNEIIAALNAGKKQIVVSEGTYAFPGSNLKADVELYCAPGTVFEGNSKLNINGATVIGATFSNPQGTAADQTINGTFKNCVFDGSNGLRWCYAGETVVFENCVFSGDVYGVHFDGGANEVVFRDCTFSGFNALGGAITKVTMERCTFKSNGRSGYNGINLWGSAELTDCTFVFDGTATEWIDLCGDNKTLTITDCVVTDGTTNTPIENVVGNYGTGNTITVDGVQVIYKAADLAAALKADKETISVILTADIDLPESVSKQMGGAATKTITIDLNGHKLNVTTTYSSVVGAVNSDATITIKNGSMTSSIANGTWDLYDLVFVSEIVVEDVTFEKSIALEKNATLKNVIINETHDYYAIWITAEGQTVTINGLTINSDGRGIKIDEQYVGTPSEVTLAVSNATFKTVSKAAIMVKSAAGAVINLSKVDIANVAADPIHAVWVDEDAETHANKVSVTGGNKIVEGAVVYVTKDETGDVAAAKNINAVLGSGSDVILGSSLKLETTVTSNGSGTTGITMENGGTFDGNGKVLSVPGASATWDSALSTNGGTIKNLTIDAGFRGIFVRADGSKVYLDNVTIDGSVYTISCDSASGHGLEATNSTFNGWTSYAGTIGNVKFTKCNFGEGAGNAFCRPYAPTEFVNCNFEAGFVIDARAAITLENCYLDGVLITAENIATLVVYNTGNAQVK